MHEGIFWRGVFHDMSKFSLTEFSAYANYFFHPNGKRRDLDTEPPLSRQNEAFNRAWCHHQHMNDHHWQFWVMETHGSHFYRPVRAIRPTWDAMTEMYCDMVGASAAQGHPNPLEGAREFYLKNQGRIELNPVATMYLDAKFKVERECGTNDNGTQ
jgi:hypothetical protein